MNLPFPMLRRCAVLAVLLIGAVLRAENSSAADPTGPEKVGSDAPAAPLDQHTLDKRTGAVLKDLKPGATAVDASVRPMLEQHFQLLQTWHNANDGRLNALWSQWAEARNPAHKDDAKAAAAAEQIDAVYATLRPQHEAFLAHLGTVLTPAQVERVKDSLTKTPGLERTYKAYLQIVPALTDEEKAFIRGKLVIAREQAMDAITNKEKANLFKRQKVQIEAFIDERGYDWKKSYAAYVAKLNTAKAR